MLSAHLTSPADARRRRLPSVQATRRASDGADSAGSAVTTDSNTGSPAPRKKSFAHALSRARLSFASRADDASATAECTAPTKAEAKQSPRKSLRLRESNAELLALLSEPEADVMVRRGSEREFSGRYYNFFPLVGCFICKGCRAPLYSAHAKFDARSGYPSFDRCFEGAVDARTEIGWRRTVALRCTTCSGHLGHLFEGEWLSATNERHSVNSLVLEYDPNPCLDEEITLRSLHA